MEHALAPPEEAEAGLKEHALDCTRRPSPEDLPGPGPATTWTVTALRRADGRFLAFGSHWTARDATYPGSAEWWPGPDDLHVWLMQRPAHVRRQVEEQGFLPVRLRIEVLPPDATRPGHAEHRPIVAEAVCEAAP